MKKTAIALSLFGILSTSSFHAAATEVSITGKIAPTACLPALPDGDTFHYETISVGASFYILPQMSTPLTITCDAPTRFAISVVDNQADTNNNPTSATLAGVAVTPATKTLGLGLDSQGNKIGTYGAMITNLRGDGAILYRLISSNSGSNWTKVSNIDTIPLLNDSNWYSWTTTNQGGAPGNTPTAHTTVTGTLTIQAAVSPAASLDLTQPIELNGSTTVTIRYL